LRKYYKCGYFIDNFGGRFGFSTNLLWGKEQWEGGTITKYFVTMADNGNTDHVKEVSFNINIATLNICHGYSEGKCKILTQTVRNLNLHILAVQEIP